MRLIAEIIFAEIYEQIKKLHNKKVCCNRLSSSSEKLIPLLNDGDMNKVDDNLNMNTFNCSRTENFTKKNENLLKHVKDSNFLATSSATVLPQISNKNSDSDDKTSVS